MVFTQFPLHPETPAEGKPRHVSGPSRVETMLAREGLLFGERKFSYNSRLAQELAKWAERQGRGDAFHDAVFRAYFVDAVNIGDLEILLRLVEKAGLPGEEARGVLSDGTFRQAVDDDWRRCRSLGVSAVPTYLSEGLAIVGAEPYERLERLVTEAGAARLTETG